MRKTYLNVDYADRELAKKLGARWDPAVKKWYCAPDSPLAKIFSWRQAQAQKPALKHAAHMNKAALPLRRADSLDSLPLFA